ncbi:MAG TPA: NHLP bacteriocin system secretion protein [Thermoanaerobaculia bacterium]
MAGEQKLFRKAALDKLSSPERLDVLMEVTSPAGWLALAALGVVLSIIIVWSVFGWIPTKVAGQGILIRGGAVLAVTSDNQGRLTQITVAPGATIEQGQVIAKMSQDDLLARIANQKALLSDMERQRGTFGTGAMEAQLQQKLRSQEQLVARGLLTRSSLLATQQELSALRQQGAGRSTQIDQMKRDIADLEGRAASASQIKSPYAGRILEITTNVGDLVGPGARILTLEELDAPIDAMIYIPAGEGKKVQPGMEVRVSPSTVKAEEYGFIIGEVTKVSDYPVTPEGLMRVLRNEALVSAMSGSSAQIEVNVRLIPDVETPSGFRWSSSKGPPLRVLSGTLASGQVVVERKRPISYILPIVKSTLGAN